MWSAKTLALIKRLFLTKTLEKEKEQFGWTMYGVMERKRILVTVVIVRGEHITARIVMMLVLCVSLKVDKNIKLL